MNQTYKATLSQYALPPSLPSWGDLEGCSTGMVTDNSSIISQGFLYAPFGEIISEYTPGWETDRIPKYAFNAKELDEENGMYYYSARYYAPPTFISRDPMFEKYPSISPYTYCANNPMKYVDPTGMKIDPTSETEWSNEKQAITDKKTSIDGEINRLTAKAVQKGWSENKLNRKTGDLKERSASLGKTLNTMSDLEKSNTTYTLKSVGGDGYFGQGKGNDAGKMVIAYSSTSSFVHEVTHGGQFHNKEIGFLLNGEVTGYDLTDEVNAYRAALAYDRYSYDNTYYSPSQITTDWVEKRGSGNYFPYKGLKPGPINAPMYKSSRKRNYAL